MKRREDGTLTTMSTFVKANFVKSHDNELTAIVCEVVVMMMMQEILSHFRNKQSNNRYSENEGQEESQVRRRRLF